ncbi:MAG: CvpA family protein [Clostridia bacterium]|nr:CvpA family protein [Clostridia bacterium]
MSWTLDIVIIVIFAITMFFAIKNGFIKTAISAASFIVAIGITFCFAGTLADAMVSTPISERIEEATAQKIEDVILESSSDATELLKGSSESFNALISVAGVELYEVDEFFTDSENASLEPAERLAKKISEPIIKTIALIISVVILFFGSRIILAIAASVLDKIAKLPILKSCNKLLGVLLGLALAVVRISLFCFIAGVLIKNAAFLGSDYISALDPDNTLLFKLFQNLDIFGFFI